MPADPPIAIDFETFYNPKDKYTLRNLTTYTYLFDARFDAYLVALHCPEFTWVGHPRNFDWSRVHGRILLAHNASFDEFVFLKLQLDGVIPESCKPAGWVCTADLAAYLRSPRNLKDAMRTLLNEEISKEVRDSMKGKHYDDAVREGREKELIDYGATDAICCYRLWEKHNGEWPAQEQLISKLNRDSGWKGLNINQPLLEEGLDKLSTKLFEAERSIPWEWEAGKTPLAPRFVRQACRDAGIECPASFAKDDPECELWEDKYASTYPWIAAVRDWRRVNMLYQKLKTMEANLRADGTMPFNLKYFGAHTGRFSGDQKFNAQNMPRGEMFGVNLRNLLVPDPGCVWVIADLAQIEARVLLWLVDDHKMLALIREGHQLYVAYAMQNLGWVGGEDLKEKDGGLYGLAKASVLAGGYGVGGPKFKATAHNWGIEFTSEGAQAAVDRYRLANPRVTYQWHKFQDQLVRSAINHDASYEVALPSGRSLVYYNPIYKKNAKGRSEVMAQVLRGDPFKKIYGGKITENVCQAIARDILVDAWERLYHAGYDVRLTSHDEFLINCPKEKADLGKIGEIIKTPPAWCSACPLDLEIMTSDHYLKM